MNSRRGVIPKRRRITRRSFLAAAAVPVIAGPLAILLSHCHAPVSQKRVIVLGIDGMDYRLTAELMSRGLLPNLSSLAARGTFSRLETSWPPLSPVAWSNFITGTDPAGHGVYDFLRRRPQDVRDGFMPRDSVSDIIPGTGRTLSIGDYVLPPADRLELLRRGQALWDVLADRGVPATVYRVPANYPSGKSKARVLCGMGTPDISGGYGSYTYLTDRPQDLELEPAGGRILACCVTDGIVKVKEGDSLCQTFLLGPVNRFLKSPSAARVEFDVYVDDMRGTVAICLQGRQSVLKQGQWSRWMDVEFELLPGVKSASGRVRFYLKQASGGLRLLVSPVNLVAGAEGLSSGGLDVELESAVGPFSTLGMPELTKPLSDGVLDLGEYQAQSDLVMQEQRAALLYLLDTRKEGFLFFHLSALDLDSHVFWGLGQLDNGGSLSGRMHPRVLERYRRMNSLVGEVRSRLCADDVLYTISDHGFEKVARHFNLVRWLHREGYLVYDRPMAERSSKCYSGVDWPRTRAYPVGFNGLYVNLQGREAQGCVVSSDYERTVEQLRRRLESLRDDATGKAVFSSIRRPAEVYQGKPEGAPDLVLGYSAGYAPSDKSALGTWEAQTLSPNTGIFTGHHLTDPELVPGVWFSSRVLSTDRPRLQDVTVTILKEFGLARHGGMTGRSLF